jgi:hypothetical protein
MYAVSLADLVKVPTSGGQGFISPDLNVNGVVKSGYTVNLLTATGGLAFTGTACNAPTAPPQSIYYASAVPVTFNGTGTRSFATDVRGTIFQAATATAAAPIAEPIGSAATPVQ